MRVSLSHLGAPLLATALAAVASSASAMEFTVKPPAIFAVGHIKNGDQYEFKKILAAAPQGQIRVVALHSGGGFVAAAGEMARMIRDQGLFTYVDGSSMTCTSACTILFAGGVRRFYVNAGGVPDGASTGKVHGLGFHEGSSSTSRDANHYSGTGTSQVINYYYEFGIPKAAALVTAAPPDAIYTVSGPKALELGIATDLGKGGGEATSGRKKKRG